MTVNDDPDKSAARHRGKNPLEWAVFALSALLVAGMFGVLAWEAATWKERPPQLSASIGTPQGSGESVAVPVVVTNHGDTAATDVEVELSLSADRSARVRFDFIPRDGIRRGQVTLAPGADPAEVKVFAITHAEP